jgi:hypothetical protein
MKEVPKRLLILIVTIQFVFSGCASTNTRSASDVVCGSEWQKGEARNIFLQNSPGWTNTKLEPGQQILFVTVDWSNGWTDTTELQFDVKPQTWYWALAYELKPGEKREDADIRMLTFGESMKKAGLEGAGEGLAPLLFPIYITYVGLKKTAGQESPHNRPYEGCCFVWIQEKESGKLVAGERP